MCRKTQDKIQPSSLPNKSRWCVMGLVDEEDEYTSSSASADWVNELDRGGLWHVREGTWRR